LERRDRLVDFGAIARADRDVGALVGQGLGDRTPDALGAAGDECM